MKKMHKVSSLAMILALLLYPNMALAQNGINQESMVVKPEATLSADSKTKREAVEGGQQNLITINFTDAEIQSVLQVLALKGGVNIVAGPDVIGKVNIRLEEVSWENALDTIVKTYGLSYEQDGNVYRVFLPKTGEGATIEEIRSEAITLEYATIEEVQNALKKVVLVGGNIEILKGSNQIVISGPVSTLKKARAMIKAVDRRMPQVQIEAKIVRTVLTKQEAMGIDWNAVARFAGSKRPTTFPFAMDAADRGPDSKFKKAGFVPIGQTQTLLSTTGGTSTGTGTSQTQNFKTEFGFPFAQATDFVLGTLDFSQFSAVLSLIKKRENTKVISSPRVTTLNNREATINVGDETGIPRFERNETTGAFEVTGFEMKKTGIVLSVTPHITDKKEIMLNANPSVSSPVEFKQITGTLTTPSFNTIEAKTNVLIHSGDTLMIGGLITDQEVDKRNRLPWLSRIPIAGWAFKSYNRPAEKVETIFFITVNLVDDVYSRKATADWRKTEAEYEAFRKYSEEEFFNERERKKKKKKEKDAK